MRIVSTSIWSSKAQSPLFVHSCVSLKIPTFGSSSSCMVQASSKWRNRNGTGKELCHDTSHALKPTVTRKPCLTELGPCTHVKRGHELKKKLERVSARKMEILHIYSPKQLKIPRRCRPMRSSPFSCQEYWWIGAADYWTALINADENKNYINAYSYIAQIKEFIPNDKYTFSFMTPRTDSIMQFCRFKRWTVVLQREKWRSAKSITKEATQTRYKNSQATAPFPLQLFWWPRFQCFFWHRLLQ